MNEEDRLLTEEEKKIIYGSWEYTKKIHMKDMYKNKLKYQFIYDDKYDRILILDNKKRTFIQIKDIEGNFINTSKPPFTEKQK